MLPNLHGLSILTDSYSASFNIGLGKTPEDHKLIATEIPSKTNVNTYAWLGDFPRMREWLGDRVIQGLDGKSYTLANKSWELTLGVPRDDIEDDQYGLYNPIAEAMGAEIKLHKAELVFQTLQNGGEATSLCYDDKPFFATDHPVGNEAVSNDLTGAGPAWYLLDVKRPLKPLIFQSRREPQLISKNRVDDDNMFWEKKAIWGADGRYAAGYGFWQMALRSKAALTEENLSAAETAMRRFKDGKGRAINITPTLLVVPPQLKLTAQKLLNLSTVSTGGENIMKGAFDLYVSSYLT